MGNNKKRPDRLVIKEEPVNGFSIKDIINKSNTGNSAKDYKQEYSELLRSPKWQKKRLEIMQRDDWKCRSCADCESELHVHHLQYTVDKPWDEPNDNLITLCNSCHRALHYLLSCPDYGLETFSLVLKLYDAIEMESIDKFCESSKVNYNG